MNRSRDTISSIYLCTANSSLFATSLFERLSREPKYQNVFLVENTEDAKTGGIHGDSPVWILFANYPIIKTLTLLQALSNRPCRILLVIDFADDISIGHLANYSLHGIITSDATYQEFLTALDTILFRYHKFLSAGVVRALNSRHLRSHPFSYLSMREREVAYLITNGSRTIDIANSLGISQKTVSTYKSRIFLKLGIETEAQLIRIALASGGGLASGIDGQSAASPRLSQ